MDLKRVEKFVKKGRYFLLITVVFAQLISQLVDFFRSVKLINHFYDGEIIGISM
jgi:hypothetical protein